MDEKMYRVTTHIRSPRSYKLPNRVVVTDDFVISKDAQTFRADIELSAASAQKALYAALSQIAAFCEVMALRDSAWEIASDPPSRVE